MKLKILKNLMKILKMITLLIKRKNFILNIIIDNMMTVAFVVIHAIWMIKIVMTVNVQKNKATIMQIYN